MAKPFENILVPYDNSLNAKRALSKAFALAELTDVSITLVHVISHHKAMAKIGESYNESTINRVRKFFNEAKHGALKRNVILKENALYGSPAEEILNFMKNKKFGIVIMGRRGVTKITGPSLGSVSNAIVQNSKVPVPVVT